MFEFKFTLDDIDAENLFGCLHNEVCKCLEYATEALADNKLKDVEWFNQRADYIKDLKSKLKNGMTEMANEM